MATQAECALHRQRVAAIQGSFAVVHAQAEASGQLFLDLLWDRAPDIARLFGTPDESAERGPHLMDMINVIVTGLAHPEAVLPILRPLARRHSEFGVEAHHYPIMGEVLIELIARTVGPARFNGFVRESWELGYRRLSAIMIRAAYGAKTHQATARQLARQVQPGLAPAAMKAY